MLFRSHDAIYYRDEARELFKRGQMGIRERAVVERIFWYAMQRIQRVLSGMRYVPDDFEGLAVPCDLRLAPSLARDSSSADTQTMYFLVQNKTVELALERRRTALIKQINAALAYPMVEELRFETTSPERIRRQMNILRLEPD